jgi:hypothetical protein
MMATKKLPKKTSKKTKSEGKASDKKASTKKAAAKSAAKRVLPGNQPLFEVGSPQKIDPAKAPVGVTLFIDLSELSDPQRSLTVSKINQFLQDVEADVLIAIAKIPNQGP